MPLSVPSFDYSVFFAGNKRVPSNVVVSASTVPVNLPNLSSQQLLAGTTYSFEIYLPCQTDGVGGYQVFLNPLNGLTATNIIYTVSALVIVSGTTTSNINNITDLVNPAYIVSSGLGSAILFIKGTITVNAAGTFQVQVAQQTATGTTTYFRGGYMQCWPY